MPAGWVRALALSQGRWLFSAACGQLRQWDLARAVPRNTASVGVERGDIQALVASKSRVFAATSDGALWWVLGCLAAGLAHPCGWTWGSAALWWPCPLASSMALRRFKRCTCLYGCRSWPIGRKGELGPPQRHKKAHGERITALALRGGILFSGGGARGCQQRAACFEPCICAEACAPRPASLAGRAAGHALAPLPVCDGTLALTPALLSFTPMIAVSYDGSIKAWDAESLEIVMDRPAAHAGMRIHCATLGPDGLLYTGGDDQVRPPAVERGRWESG